MHIDRWFQIAGTIGAKLCARLNGKSPDYLMLSAEFLGYASKAQVSMDRSAAKLWEDGAALAKEMMR